MKIPIWGRRPDANGERDQKEERNTIATKDTAPVKKSGNGEREREVTIFVNLAPFWTQIRNLGLSCIKPSEDYFLSPS